MCFELCNIAIEMETTYENMPELLLLDLDTLQKILFQPIFYGKAWTEK